MNEEASSSMRLNDKLDIVLPEVHSIRVSPTGSSKRKSRPVKRILEQCEPTSVSGYARETDEPSLNSSMGKPWDLINTTTAETVNSEDTTMEHQQPQIDLKESLDDEQLSESPTMMNQAEMIRRLGEMMGNNNAVMQTAALQTALQSFMAITGCSTDPMAALLSAGSMLHQQMEPLSPADALLNMATFGAAMNSIGNSSLQTPMNSGNMPLLANLMKDPNNYNRNNATPSISDRNRLDMTSPILHATKPSSKRKLFNGNKELMLQEASTISMEERIDLDDLENFAQQFKKQRIKFGFTQGDVGMALGKRYGTDFSQTTISRFEALNLSFKNMCKLRPLLKEWLADAESAIAGGASLTDLIEKGEKQAGTSHSGKSSSVSPSDTLGTLGMGRIESSSIKRRRKRTNLDMSQRTALDAYFTMNPRPDHDKMTEIANVLELDRDVVRVWFCNRRQKLRRTDDPEPDSDNIFMAVKNLAQSHDLREMSGEDANSSKAFDTHDDN